MTGAVNNSYLEPALAYAARGWSVIPIKHISEKGKEPACKWKKFQTERPTETMLRNWFRRKDLDGLAVICGDVSGGLVIRDFDDADAYYTWAGKHKDLAALLHSAPPAIGSAARARFLRRWLAASGRGGGDGWRTWARAVHAKEGRLAAHAPRHAFAQAGPIPATPTTPTTPAELA